MFISRQPWFVPELEQGLYAKHLLKEDCDKLFWIWTQLRKTIKTTIRWQISKTLFLITNNRAANLFRLFEKCCSQALYGNSSHFLQAQTPACNKNILLIRHHTTRQRHTLLCNQALKRIHFRVLILT